MKPFPTTTHQYIKPFTSLLYFSQSQTRSQASFFSSQYLKTCTILLALKWFWVGEEGAAPPATVRRSEEAAFAWQPRHGPTRDPKAFSLSDIS